MAKTKNINKRSAAAQIKKKKLRRWPFFVGALLIALIASYVWMLGTSRIETASVIAQGAEGTRSVVVYFTRTGETKAGVDAMSAATPNTNSDDALISDTEAAARMIAEVTGADRVQLFTERYYRDSYTGTAARAFVERYLGLWPAIGSMPDLSAYDTIYIGYPIWWFNAPMAVATFLEETDLSGKTVVPFCTSQDNGVDLSMDMIRNGAKGATVLDGLRIHNTSRQEVESWLTLQGIALPTSGQRDASQTSGLIVYFDYSENIDTTGLDVDAVSQASMAEGRESGRGNLLVMVDELQARTGYDVYPIRIADQYPPAYMDMVGIAQSDKEGNSQFAFSEPIPDLSAYDTIFLAAPIWWYDLPQPVINFLERADLSGKQLIYLSINRGSGNGGALSVIEQLQPNVQIVAEHTVSAMLDDADAREEINGFLDELMNGGEEG